MATRAHWKGNPADPTEHHHAIPAHDLTDEDYEALDTEHRRTVRESKLYRYVRPPERAAKPKRSGRGKPSADAVTTPDVEPISDPDPDPPDEAVVEEPAVSAEEGRGY